MGCFGDSPDYEAAAQRQGAANRDAAEAESLLNNPDQFMPGYQVKWVDNRDPVTGTLGRPAKAVTLGADQQAIFDMQQGLLKYAASQMEYNRDKLGEAFASDYRVPGSVQTDFSSRYMPNEYYQTASGIDAAPGLYSNLDFSWASPMPTADTATRDRVTQSIYDRGQALLDQSYGTRQNQLDTRLSNQGIFAGSNAFAGAQRSLADQRQRDYNDLAMRAVEAGGAEMARDFGLGMQARQQSTGEIAQQGAFRNQARNQLVNELLADMQARNTGVNQSFNTALAQAGLTNAGRSQALSELTQSKLLPINTLLAVLGGQQLNLPGAQPYTPTQIAPPPIYQAAKDAGNYDAALTGSLLSTLGRVGGAAIPLLR